MSNKNHRVVKNTVYLYILTIAKLIFPMITLPYLTRVLTTDTYGMVSFVKACMSYVQILIDFGFVWSSTKDIADACQVNEKCKINILIGDTIAAKFLLGIVSGVIIFSLCFIIPLLRKNVCFTLLYFVAIFLSIFVADFFFRGIERMELASIPFTVAKALSTILTLVMVKSDQNILIIPMLEIFSTLIAIIISLVYIYKIGYKIVFSGIHDWITKIKESFVYFMSSFATTAFGALNTLLVGIYMSTTEVAYWSICSTIVAAVQALYNPILNSLYPHMIHKKSRNIIKKILFLFMPVVALGCIIVLLWSEPIITLVCGNEYYEASSLFRYLTPLLFISFPSQLYGWPALGAIGKAKEISLSTIIAACVQAGGLFVLILLDRFTFVYLVVIRFVSETVLLIVRYSYYHHFKKLYND